MVGDDLQTTVGQLHLVLPFTQNNYNYHEGCGVAHLIVRRLDVGHPPQGGFSHWADQRWGDGDKPRQMTKDDFTVWMYVIYKIKINKRSGIMPPTIKQKWMRCSFWMRCSRVLERLTDSHCPGFDPSILRRSEIWGAAYEAVLNKLHT